MPKTKTPILDHPELFVAPSLVPDEFTFFDSLNCYAQDTGAQLAAMAKSQFLSTEHRAILNGVVSDLEILTRELDSKLQY